MDTEKVITLETLTISNQELKSKNQELTKEIERLNQELYNINEKIPATKTALRVKDIVYRYSVAKSTVWLYAKAGDITPIKNSSRVTTFDAEEVEAFFTERNNRAMDITPYRKTSKAGEKLEEKQNSKDIYRIKYSLKNSPNSPLK